MIGIDIGGANLKIVDEKGVHIQYCPLWEGSSLPHILSRYQGQSAAVVMTGELADCYASKQEGIEKIVAAVQSIFPDALFYGTDGRFHQDPVPELAAANWMASADWPRGRYPDALLVDMGSTTTDIIPLGKFERLKGMTDLRRLQGGCLLYTGLLRTTVAAMLSFVTIQGKRTPVSAEHFAIAADVHLILGHINPAEYMVPTPDGKPTTREASLRRLARVVCADMEEIGGSIAVESIARQVWEAQRTGIGRALEAMKKTSGSGELICAGIGSSLLAQAFEGRDLKDELGTSAQALPARAVREVALRTAGL